MSVPQLLLDIIRLLLNLAPLAAVGCLVLAGISLRREGGTNFIIGGGFTKSMFWAVVFLTLPQTLSFLAARGLNVPVPSGGVSTDWVSNIYGVVLSFMQEMVLARLVPTLAAYFVIRAVLDAAEGNTPLKSVLTAMFLLASSHDLEPDEQFQLRWGAGAG